jgi:D-threo-aldose 1-dehydrogenase
LRRLRLGETRIETSELGLGCADLFREPSGRRRQRLLAAALDSGISHFDVAPMYGLGLVEREVGRFARGKRDSVVIATKFGIDPTPAARLLARAQAPIERLLAAAPNVRRSARPLDADPRSGAVGRRLYRSCGYDAAAARAGLERSLRELGTDHLDILFLHDPSPGDVRSDDVAAYLDSAQATGRIRAWGIAGEPRFVPDIARQLGSRIPVLQLRGDLLAPPWPGTPGLEAEATILFGVLGRPLARILAHVRTDERVRRRWSEAVGVDCGDPEALASLLLREALRRNPGGPVLFGTIRTARIEAAVAAAAEPSDAPALDRLRALAEAELAAPERRP